LQRVQLKLTWLLRLPQNQRRLQQVIEKQHVAWMDSWVSHGFLHRCWNSGILGNLRTWTHIYIFHRELDLKHIRVFIFGALDDSLMIFDDFRRETHL